MRCYGEFFPFFSGWTYAGGTLRIYKVTTQVIFKYIEITVIPREYIQRLVARAISNIKTNDFLTISPLSGAESITTKTPFSLLLHTNLNIAQLAGIFGKLKLPT